MTAPIPDRPFEPLRDQWAVALTSYRRDGTPVSTTVNIAVDGERAFVRTYEQAWKFKRIRRDPRVLVAPSTAKGRPTGPPIEAHARVLEGAAADHARRLIERKHPWFQGILVPLAHRLRGYRTVHLELRPADADPG